ncbi:response regulator transcription factor [Marinobacter sp.]|jgi:DNA-binding NarL/FixJ family response regulator|uniref:LuxR C-terminal-related transcriptional regulator n=1 Tax=Marinobacter sp. TaxID=50741 RepID=UPI0019C46E68|nr:response regulator transcription factor [Marinobacter sp.]MBC7192476.1 response regulator transcription factor [Marinobacter sp.]
MTQTIIIADDHPLFRAALKQAVNQAVPEARAVEVGSVKALQEAVDSHPDADLVLLDLNMPGAHGFSGLVFMRGQYPGLPVVVVSGSEDLQVMRRSIDYGASGFIPKSAPLPTITDAIRDILEGEVWLPDGIAEKIERMQSDETDFSGKLASLTPQQFRVLGMLAEGLLNKQIAYELDVSEATIKAHITAVFRKLNVRNRTQAVIAIRQMEIDPSDTSLSGT